MSCCPVCFHMFRVIRNRSLRSSHSPASPVACDSSDTLMGSVPQSNVIPSSDTMHSIFTSHSSMSGGGGAGLDERDVSVATLLDPAVPVQKPSCALSQEFQSPLTLPPTSHSEKPFSHPKATYALKQVEFQKFVRNTLKYVLRIYFVCVNKIGSVHKFGVCTFSVHRAWQVNIPYLS